MFADRIFAESSAEYTSRLIIIDQDDIRSKYDYENIFVQNGFEIIYYNDDLNFRVSYNEAIYSSTGKYLVIASDKAYIPYDIRQIFKTFYLSYLSLFPNLNDDAVRILTAEQLDILSFAYKSCFSSYADKSSAEQYIRFDALSRKNVEQYLNTKLKEMYELAESAKNYIDWRNLAVRKSFIDVKAAEYDISVNTDKINLGFVDFVLKDFGRLSVTLEVGNPVTVSRAMEYMTESSSKFVIIIMDGMSEFDWQIISRGFADLCFSKTDIYAMIPTTTSISRQCLLSNKFPKQLIDPWHQSKEKQEFIQCAKSLGFSDSQIAYNRGYNSEFDSSVKCGAVIINDVDDMLHGQKQGRRGMYNDISLLTKTGKLQTLVKQLLSQGFDVYISADHGNTLCTGMGKLTKTGVETETKSRRMVVLKDYADKQGIIDKFNMIDYPKTYLDDSYEYLICNVGQSFDSLGEEVISHGGITLDEVIVPFITIKAEDNNG